VTIRPLVKLKNLSFWAMTIPRCGLLKEKMMPEIFDIIIIGRGPAGLTAGI